MKYHNIENRFELEKEIRDKINVLYSRCYTAGVIQIKFKILIEYSTWTHDYRLIATKHMIM